ncbi:hypothetical protein H1235_10930 [Pseudoxanthomonas sp. NC8]|nr:hypothetical protein H1235_10930 [Pseudoxanthomonas sp. NC8]
MAGKVMADTGELTEGKTGHAIAADTQVTTVHPAVAAEAAAGAGQLR